MNNTKIFFLFALLLCLIVSNTCQKLEKSMLVSTGEVSNIETNSADAGGVIIDLGDGAIEHGHCYGTSPGVTVAGTRTQKGKPSAGGFTSPLTGLTAGTKYYVKAYISSATETVYGKEEIPFTTEPASLPVLTTAAVTAVTFTSATSGGEVTDDGGATVTERGVCWNTASGPSVSNSKTTDASGTGVFTSNISGLTPGTTYYVRAWATNSAGTAYGNEFIFTTTAISLPVIATSAISEITQNSAVSGGEISSDGGSSVTARGVCWSTSVNPTVALSTKTTDGTGTGTFTSSLSGLTAGTTYYVRAYATNSVGTAYGNEVSFTTNSPAVAVPTLTTIAVTVITSATVKSGGNISSDGGAAVTSRGVCWNVFANPTIANNTTSDGTGPGIFGSSLTGLTANTTYYVRAYATNSAGTAYGNEISFTTTIQVTDIDGNKYNTVKIGTQLWMQENLKTTKYRDGTSIKYITDDTEWNKQTSGAYCWFYNDIGNKNIYGAMYNYHATVENINLCPTGWHVPTDVEWTTLTTFLGGEAVAGGKLKETGYDHWGSPNTGATNETGFTGRGGGHRYDLGYEGESSSGYWWTSSEDGSLNAYYREMSMNSGDVLRSSCEKSRGKSVRCVQGEGAVLPAVTTTAVTGITASGASSGGNVTSDGGALVVIRGVCWSTAANPTTGDPKTNEGTGPGVFTSTLSGLAGNTTYHVRAYATNSAGTAYGNDLMFTTATVSTVPDAPTIGTATAGNAQATVTFTPPANDGGSAITGYMVTSSPDGKTDVGTSSPITVIGLTNGIAYTFTVTATNANGTGPASAASNSVIPSAPVTDIDGNVYNTIYIGTQLWIAENLKTTTYRNGTTIPLVTDNTTWSNLTTPAYCWYSNDPATYKAIYGALYNWYTVNTGNLCPTGWHVPTDAEWTTMENYLISNGYNYDGTTTDNKIAKSLAATTNWASSTNPGAVGNTDYPTKRNATGFTALPGGFRDLNGNFGNIDYTGYSWSATELGTLLVWSRYMFYDNVDLYRSYNGKQYGFSVRCVRD